MRGLKLTIINTPGDGAVVASLTDAWIETLVMQGDSGNFTVASLTDAWIETSMDI